MKGLKVNAQGEGGLTGVLYAEDGVSADLGGQILRLSLIGNTVPTEYNEVCMVGRKVGEDVFEVDQMESLPKKDGEMLLLTGKGSCIFALRKNDVKEAKKETSASGTPYLEISAPFEKGIIHLKIYGEVNKEPSSGTLVFLLKDTPKCEEQSFGSGYAVKKIYSYYGMGVQLLS